MSIQKNSNSDCGSNEKSTSLTKETSSSLLEEKKLHDLCTGDHVIRWTWIGVYPIQVHGIVLSSNPDFVTIVDCGLSAVPPQTKQDDEATEQDFDEKEFEKVQSEVKKESQKRQRLNIITLFTDDPKLQKWKKIRYQPASNQSEYESFSEEKGDADVSTCLEKDENSTLSGDDMKEELSSKNKENSVDEKKDLVKEESTSSWFAGNKSESEDNKKICEKSTISDDDTKNESTKKDDEKCRKEQAVVVKEKSNSFWFWKNNSDSGDNKKKRVFLPQSDPVPIVLERIRFLLHQKESNDILPPHHVLYANSECIAVWCKTGTFSTLQASIFLHSQTVGQVKSVSTLAAFLAGQTVTVTTTVPAGGILGFFGATTTTTAQVGLISTQPWIVPALACYSLFAIGAPVVLLYRCRHKWRNATQNLNDSFWSYAEPHIYVCAIQHWSNLSINDSH